MSDTLGDRIRKARLRYGMSQAELSRRVHVSKNTMNLIEKNRTPDPAASIVKAVAEVLRVSPQYLLGMTEDMGSERTPAELAQV